MTGQPTTLALDDECGDTLALVARITGMAPESIVRKLLGAHMHELHEYIRYARDLSDKPAKAQQMAPWALHNYGPGSLIDEIKTWDATYRPLAEQIFERVHGGTR